jgi:hypothetical protein
MFHSSIYTCLYEVEKTQHLRFTERAIGRRKILFPKKSRYSIVLSL